MSSQGSTRRIAGRFPPIFFLGGAGAQCNFQDQSRRLDLEARMLIILVTLEVLETLGVLLRNLCLGVNSTPPEESNLPIAEPVPLSPFAAPLPQHGREALTKKSSAVVV